MTERLSSSLADFVLLRIHLMKIAEKRHAFHFVEYMAGTFSLRNSSGVQYNVVLDASFITDDDLRAYLDKQVGISSESIATVNPFVEDTEAASILRFDKLCDMLKKVYVGGQFATGSDDFLYAFSSAECGTTIKLIGGKPRIYNIKMNIILVDMGAFDGITRDPAAP